MKILVVEDDLALSAGLCFELDMNGYITVRHITVRKCGSWCKTNPLIWLYWM